MNEMNEAFETLKSVSEENKITVGEITVYMRMLREWHRLGYPRKFHMMGKELSGSDYKGDISNAQGYVRDLERKGLIKRRDIAYNNVGQTKYIIVRKKIATTKKEKKDHEQVIRYLNERTGRRFSLKTKAYKAKIYARLSEGYTIDDMKTVIDKKVAEWKGTEYEKYLSPTTLFSPSHFDVYLNQADITPTEVKRGGKYI